MSINPTRKPRRVQAKSLHSMPQQHSTTLANWQVILGLQLCLALPYLVGWMWTPPGHKFGWIVYNPDDPYVYLSWMRQAADGHPLLHNLFTLEPQRGLSFHLLFEAMGAIAGAAHLPLIAVYHAARVAMGILLAMALCSLLQITGFHGKALTWALSLALLGSGLGWIYFITGSPIVQQADEYHLPTDLWMTETVPFLAMMLSPLFSAGLGLILACFASLLKAEATGRWRCAMLAGFWLLLLGNIHTYDILLVNAVWVLFLIITTTRATWVRQFWTQWNPLQAWLRYSVVFLISLPSAIYQWWVLHAEAVFHSRADVPTLSPALPYYLLGAGLLIMPAAYGAYRSTRPHRQKDRAASLPKEDASKLCTNPLTEEGAGKLCTNPLTEEEPGKLCTNPHAYAPPVVLFLAVWAVAGLALPYVPLPFQRKLAIGLDIPYLILAGVGVEMWLTRRGLTPPRKRAVAAAIVAVALLSNTCFVRSDLQLLALNQNNVLPMAPLYVPEAEIQAMDWLRQHGKPGDTVLSMPWMGNIIPSHTGLPVYLGHWGETKDFLTKLHFVNALFGGREPAETASLFLRQNHIKLVYFGQMEQTAVASANAELAGTVQLPPANPLKPPFPVAVPLRVIYNSGTPRPVIIYRVGG